MPFSGVRIIHYHAASLSSRQPLLYSRRDGDGNDYSLMCHDLASLSLYPAKVAAEKAQHQQPYQEGNSRGISCDEVALHSRCEVTESELRGRYQLF